MADQIVEVVAAALRFYLRRAELSDVRLSQLSKVSANTIGNTRDPSKRLPPSKSGKPGSIKLVELARIADALGVHVADLVTDMSDEDRESLFRRRIGDYVATNSQMPPWPMPKSKREPIAA